MRMYLKSNPNQHKLRNHTTLLGAAMKRALIGLAFLVLLLSLVLSAPPAMAQSYRIKAGGTYIVKVDIHKPSQVTLEEGKWQVRAYFHSGSTCYAVGTEDPVYGNSGWWTYRKGGERWAGEPEDKTYQITVPVISDLPSSGSANLRVRLVIEDIDAKLSGGEEATSGYVTFTVGGATYQYQYKKEFDDYLISGEGFEAKIVYKDYKKNYDLYIDQNVAVSISGDAPDADLFTMPSPINANLISSVVPETSYDLPFKLKLVIAGVMAVVIAGAAAYLLTKGRRTGEGLESVSRLILQ